MDELTGSSKRDESRSSCTGMYMVIDEEYNTSRDDVDEYERSIYSSRRVVRSMNDSIKNHPLTRVEPLAQTPVH
jgi:hypothetical protein